MKRIIALLLSGFITLTGCENQSDNKESISMGDLIDNKEIVNTDYEKTIKESSHDNISISDDFVLNIPKYDSLGIYEVVYANNFDSKSEELFQNYIPEYDTQKAVNNDGDNGLRQIQYNDDKTFSFITSIGGFVISDKDCLNRVLYGDAIPFIQTDLVNINNKTEYKIGTETVSLKELSSTSDAFISEFINLADYPNMIEPFAFSTQTIDDGNVAGLMHCRYCYKDIPIFDLQSMHDEYSTGIATLTPPTCTFINGNKIGQFTTTCAICDYKTIQSVDKIISPADAVDLTSKKLSGHLNYELQYEELVYFPTCNENKLGIEPGNGYEPGDVIKLTPYWIVYFNTNWWHETFAAVNAITGEVDFVNNAR